MLNPNFTDYKIPTAKDIPDEIVPIIVEVPQPDGPFGARGVGEHTMIPAAPMVANAVQDALGIRIKSMPIHSNTSLLLHLPNLFQRDAQNRKRLPTRRHSVAEHRSVAGPC